MADAVMRALRAESGSILAFLPGQGEIRRVEERLKQRISDPTIVLAPLYGAMDMKAQDLALEPAPKGLRKVVLATSIAETSITIEGVRVVIDSGLARVPRFEPDVGVTRLETVRVSRAAADQRRGRAGRTEPGVCYRLWEEPQTQSLPAYPEPEIRSADLAALLLDCAEWGTADPRSLSWIDPPSVAAIDAAREELTELEALDAEGRITPSGRRLRSLPLPPRLARMVISAAETRPRAGGCRDRRRDRRAWARRQRRRSRPSAGRIPPRPLAPRQRHAQAGRRLGPDSELRIVRRKSIGEGISIARLLGARLSRAHRQGARRIPANSSSPTVAAPTSMRRILWRDHHSWSRRSCRDRRRRRASCSQPRPRKRTFLRRRAQRIRAEMRSNSIRARPRCGRAMSAGSTPSCSPASRAR